MRSLIVAFAMYTRIPMPKVRWTERSLRYAMSFFPLIGVLIGGLQVLLWWICHLLHFGTLLQSALLCALPVLVTGGIHLDGFCDTVDALNSRKPREEKLEILKDPHTGVFAVVFCCVYFLTQFGLFAEIVSWRTVLAVGLEYVLSRSLSAGALMLFRSAKPSGTAYRFKSQAGRKTVLVCALLYMALSFAALGVLNVYMMLIVLGMCALTLLCYRLISYRQFGGVTGDLAGWFLQLCELMILLSVAFSRCVGIMS